MMSDDDIRRSTLRRYLPASLVLMLPGIIGGPGLDPVYYSMILLNIVGLSFGYAWALKLGKRLTGSRKGPSGLRAILTGVLSTPVLGFGYASLIAGGSVGTLGLLLNVAAVALGAGALVGATTFIHRKTPALPEPLRELPGEPLEEWFARVEKEADRQPWYRSLKSTVTKIVTPPITRRDLCAAG
ncbi:MAG: hypothetical protein ACC682_13825 [Gemmatimonadota bacterium]